MTENLALLKAYFQNLKQWLTILKEDPPLLMGWLLDPVTSEPNIIITEYNLFYWNEIKTGQWREKVINGEDQEII